MTRHIQFLVTMFIFVLTQALEHDGEGVCNKTEIQTEYKTIQEEIITGTTEEPCIIRSFIDQIACGNRKPQFKNVTALINKTIEVSRPITTLFCCEGYVLAGEQCNMKTTVGTTQEETTLTTTRMSETTHKENARLTTSTATNVVTAQTKEEITRTIVDKTTEIKSNTKRYETTQTETNVLTTETDIITTEDIHSSGDESFTFMSRDTTVNKGLDGAKVTKYDPFAGVEVSSEATVVTSDSDPRDVLLYVFAACALVFLVAMVIVIVACHRRSRKTKKRPEITTTLAMDDIIQNGHRVSRLQSGDYCTEINENASNAYTELNTCNGESHYDELKDVNMENEDPYEELPDCDDYDDCDASPRLQKNQKTKVFTK